MTKTKCLTLFTALPELRAVEITDSPTLQAIFEIYAALALDNRYNAFHMMPERTTASRPFDVARFVALTSAICGNLPQIRRKEAN